MGKILGLGCQGKRCPFDCNLECTPSPCPLFWNRENPRSCLHCNFWKCGHILVLVWNKYAWGWPSFLRFYGQSIQLPNDVHHFTNGYYRSCLHPPVIWIFKKIIPAQSLHLITFAYHYLNCESLLLSGRGVLSWFSLSKCNTSSTGLPKEQGNAIGSSFIPLNF